MFIACCGLLICILRAQAQEISVPLDTTGKIFVITIELENKLGLFQEYSGFIEARLYQANENEFFLEVLEQKDSTVVRNRIPQTTEQVFELRQQVSLAISIRSPQALYDQSGRGGLIVNSAILSAGFYGWSIPVAMKAEGSGAVALYFLITAAGVLGPYFATENADISRSTAMMDFYGGSRGIAHGVALHYALDPKRDGELDSEQAADNSRALYGWATLVGLSERVAFTQWASRTKMTEGKAAAIGVCGDFGLGLSAMQVVAHDLWNREHQSEAGLIVLGGSVAGMVAGSQLADHGHYTRGDGYVLRGIGIIGAAIPAAIADVADQDGRTAANMATVGSIVGIGVGHRLLRNVDFSSSQGLTVLLAEFAVATLATAAVVATEVDNSWPYSMAAAIGGAAGFALGYVTASKSARTIRKTSDNVDFQFNPLPLMTDLPSSGDKAIDHRANMALHLTYRF